MKSAIIEKIFDVPFEELYASIRNNVLSSGFLLLHEINTQEIVSKHGVEIRPLKQLLFFHPNYIQQITNEDELAINEIPIKVVLIEREDGRVSVSFPNPVIRLSDYNIKSEMAAELLERVEGILKIE